MQPKRPSFSQLRSFSSQSVHIPVSKLQSQSPKQSTSKNNATTSQQQQQPHTSTAKVTEESRAIVPVGIHVTDLIPELRNLELLSHVCYFGKYGKVVKACIEELYMQRRKRGNLIAFITYSSQLQAALALVAMQGYDQTFHKCYCNAATSRFCSQFIKGNNCPFNNCLYLHQLVPDQLVDKHRKKEKLQLCIQQAKTTIAQNLPYFVQKQYHEHLQKKKPAYHSKLIRYKTFQGDPISQKAIEFPSISDTFSMLIKEGRLNPEKYIEVKNAYKDKIKKQEKQSTVVALAVEQATYKIRGVKNQLGSRFDSYPYILKRYLNPQLASQTLSLANQSKENYFKQRQKELQEKKYYRKNACFSLTKSEKLNSKKITALIHQKILQAYEDESFGKSRFEFAKNESIVEDNIKNYLRSVLIGRQ